jgi:hypothetical protein
MVKLFGRELGQLEISAYTAQHRQMWHFSEFLNPLNFLMLVNSLLELHQKNKALP